MQNPSHQGNGRNSLVSASRLSNSQLQNYPSHTTKYGKQTHSVRSDELQLLDSQSLSEERGKGKRKTQVQLSCLIQVEHFTYLQAIRPLLYLFLVKFLAHQKSISSDVLANHQRVIHPLIPKKDIKIKE